MRYFRKVFGTRFLASYQQVHCALGFLHLRNLVQLNGTIAPEHTEAIPKPYLWNYLFYLMYHNRKAAPFQAISSKKKLQRELMLKCMIAYLVSKGEEVKPFKYVIHRRHLVEYLNYLITNFALERPYIDDLFTKKKEEMPAPAANPQTQTVTVDVSDPALLDGKEGDVFLKLDIEVKPNQGGKQKRRKQRS